MQCIDKPIILTSALTITFPPKNNESGRAGRVEGKEKKKKVKVGVWREERGIKRSGTAKMQVRNGAQSLFR